MLADATYASLLWAGVAATANIRNRAITPQYFGFIYPSFLFPPPRRLPSPRKIRKHPEKLLRVTPAGNPLF
jgi:hypothetical protein